ncbi:MAG: peptide chain release factor N(5)-glutamine methyltransferase, partial [Treponema sp.]|nr:peptide chain release factor N(5)-glutamine methyltransferase [Treponema sp.]
MTIQEARKYGFDSLEKTSPSAQLDSDVLLGAVSGFSKTDLIFKREHELSCEEEEKFASYIAARKTGLPVAYITGHKEFYGYDFLVTPDVLIPKPDTELLVEKALEIVKEKCGGNHLLTVCDMCTGSGCVGISLLLECEKFLPKEKLPLVILADISSSALDIARQNVDMLFSSDAGLLHLRDRVRFVRTNLFEAVSGSFDLIVTNPPYIPSKEARDLLKDGRSEPILALDGDVNLHGDPTGEEDGLGIMRNLVPQAVAQLSPDGVLIAEAGEY